MNQLTKRHQKSLLILDDQMESIADSKFFLDMATTLSHHMNVSYILTLQNLFFQGKFMRSIHLQTTVYVLFKSPRDVSQLKILANQLGILSPNAIRYAYKEAVQRKFHYLVIDVQLETPDLLRLRSGILPGEQLVIYTE